MKFLFALLVTALMIGCGINDKPFIVSGVRNLSELATTEVVVKKYVLGKKEKKVLLQLIRLTDANFAAETYAYLKFGIDLSGISESDISISGQNVTVKVPNIKLISFTYPPSEFKQVDELTDRFKFLNSVSPHDIDIFLQEAQTQIGISIDHMSIFEIVKSNTENALLALVSGLGYESVAIIFENEKIDIAKYFES